MRVIVADALASSWRARPRPSAMARWHDLVGAWWIGLDDRGRLVEHEVDQHHCGALRLGLLRDEVLTRIDRTSRVAVLTACMERGWVRIRVPRRSQRTEIHAEGWTWGPTQREALRRWTQRHGVRPDHPIVLGTVATRIAVEARLDETIARRRDDAAPEQRLRRSIAVRAS